MANGSASVHFGPICKRTVSIIGSLTKAQEKAGKEAAKAEQKAHKEKEKQAKKDSIMYRSHGCTKIGMTSSLACLGGCKQANINTYHEIEIRYHAKHRKGRQTNTHTHASGMECRWRVGTGGERKGEEDDMILKFQKHEKRKAGVG